jgi:NitT/TauT family transport system permease protein
VAPIAVMWFGFEWPSKAAVVVLMTFFPMLVSTLAGLQASQRLERELMHSYAASYLPAPCGRCACRSAMPFMFAALKVNASLALIGAIVAEFFGSPTVGLGFRISTEAPDEHDPGLGRHRRGGRHRLGGLCAAQSGTAVAFWHPSVRGRR